VSVHPEPVPEPGGPAVAACPLCGATVYPEASRCGECGMTLAGVGGRPAAFGRRSLWLWAGGLLAIYLVVLVIVAVASTAR
jgi:hypothetical protein